MTTFRKRRPEVSVIVCTHNRAALLRRMLTSFYAQPELPRLSFELFVVDNHSTDDTKTVLKEFEDFPYCHMLYEHEVGLSSARNRAMMEARGRFVAFLDDDVLVSPHWMQALLDAYTETTADAVGGRAVLLLEDKPPAWMGPEFRRCLSEVDLGDERIEECEPGRLYALNVSFRRQLLERAGGFDTKLGRKGTSLYAGEERALLRQLAAEGRCIVYEPNASVAHIISADRLTWDYMVRVTKGTAASRPRDAGALSFVHRLRRAADSGLKAGLYALFALALSPWGRNRYRYRFCLRRAIFQAHLARCWVRTGA